MMDAAKDRAESRLDQKDINEDERDLWPGKPGK
jgi:hypothetical protein